MLKGIKIDENRTYFATCLGMFAETVRMSANEGLVTLGVKFLNFCIAKSTQFRCIDPRPPFTKFVFWFTLAWSVPSLYSS